MKGTFFAALVSAAALTICAQAASAASIWTPLSSGTTHDITAVVDQSPTRIWYATASGDIAYWNGSGFSSASGIPAGTDLTGLAFQSTAVAGGPGTSGLYGFAVSGSGTIFTSTDGGQTWAAEAPPLTYADCKSATPVPVSELNTVVFRDDNHVYALGDKATLLEAGSPVAPFQEINKNGSGTCAVTGSDSDVKLQTAAFMPATPANGLLGGYNAYEGAKLFSTTNGFTSGSFVSRSLVGPSTAVAIDPGNVNRIFLVGHTNSGSGCESYCLTYSTDAGRTFAQAPIAQSGTRPLIDLFGITARGGTEVAAGYGGTIVDSNDGVHFYDQPADGALTTENWLAEDAYDAQHALVGGQGGALAITAAANQIPTARITLSGPATVTTGTPFTVTATVSDPGHVLNPSGYTWSSPASGQGTRAGATASSATYTLTAPGSYTVTLAWTTVAGGTVTATLPVTASAGAVPGPKPGPVPGPVPGPTTPTGTSGRQFTTGGGVVVIYRTVTLTGRSSRYIPVPVGSKRGRRLTATLYSATGRHPRPLATASLTLRHGGFGTIKVKLSAGVKTGHYLLVVRVYDLHGHALGKRVQVAFVLR